VALTATIHTFDIDLSDSDRQVYESLALRVAHHPSETEDYLVTRVLAYALECTEGIEFSRGLAEPDEPAIAVRDLTGAIRSWIDVGAPDAARLHRASKAVPRVAVYTHKDPARLIAGLAGERIHRVEALDALRFTTVPKGLPAAAMTASQHELLRGLLDTYVGRLPDEIAEREMAKVRGPSFSALHLGWAGSLEPGRPHYYRIPGHRLLVEYDNTTRDANHVHTVWRDPVGDFGMDVLGAHRRRGH